MTRYDELLKEGQTVYRTHVPDRKALATQAPRPMTDAQRRRYDELLEEGRAVYRTAAPTTERKYPQWVLDRYALCEACEVTAQTDSVRECAKVATAKPCSQRRRIFEGWGCAAGHWKKGDPGGSSASSVITDRNAPEVRNIGNTVPQPHKPWFAFVRRHRENRDGHTEKIIKQLQSAGYECPVVEEKDLLPLIDKKPTRPLAVLRWDEHSLMFSQRPWRTIVKRLYDLEILPVSVDFAYFGHYEGFILDPYRSEGGCRLIDADWAGLPETVEWGDAPADIVGHRARVLEMADRARREGPVAGLKPESYVVIWVNHSLHLGRDEICADTKGKKHWNHLIEVLCRRARQCGLMPVVKLPSKDPFKVPEGAMRFVGVKDEYLNVRLAVHATNNIISNSSVSNLMALLDLPVTALGRSWYSGKGIFWEPEMLDEMAIRGAPVIPSLRAKWCNFWMRRQMAKGEVAERLLSLVEEFQALRGVIVTCVYVVDDKTERVTKNSLLSVKANQSGWPHWVCIDDAPPAFEAWCYEHGFRVYRPSGGTAPRMASMLKHVVDREPDVDVLWVVESDNLLPAGTFKRMRSRWLELRGKGVASLAATTVDAKGTPCYPSFGDQRFRGKPWSDPEYVEMERNHLCCTFWDREELARMDWSNVPQLHYADVKLSQQALERGRLCLATAAVKVHHLGKVSRSAANATA